MKNVNVKILIILLIFSTIESKKTLRPIQEFKFLNCKCLVEPWFSEPNLYKNWTCFAKNWSRNTSTINADFTLIKPLYKIFVSKIQILCLKNFKKFSFLKINFKFLNI